MQTCRSTKFSYILLLQFLICAFSWSTAHGQDILIRAGIPIYIHPDETAPVRRAAKDLLRDLQTVLGKSSSLVNAIPKTGPAIIIATGDRYKGKQPAISGWEAHRVFADKGRIVLNGADMRGTIYAVYTFSELMLGVKPLWFWTSEPPARKEPVLMKADFVKSFSSPYVKYRTWLPNDTDFLSPWQNISKENYEAFYETMLRLKLNTLEGAVADRQSFSPPFPAGKSAMVAQQRGLAVTGHHLNIFGSSYGNWEDYWKNVRHLPVPELAISNRQALKEWWGYHIELSQKNNLEVVWLVGFRGNRDIPFWEFFKDAPADASARAKVIEEMVRIQIDLLKEKMGDQHPPMRLTLYNEMSNLVADGFFHIPEEPSLIRNFVAARRDHFPAQDIRSHKFSGEPVGYYMNFQFTSTGSHLAQAEGPRKMEENFRMVDSLGGGKLVFSVVNAGNMREHLLELSANADLLWNFKSFQVRPFLEQFSTSYFGAQRGPEIATLYKEFFDSYWQQKKSDIPGFERQYIFQDMRYGRAMEMLLGDLETGKYSPNPLDNHPLDNPDKGSVGYFRVVPADNASENQVEALEKGTSASIAKLEKITARADQIYSQLSEHKIFFDDNLRGQAYVMLHLNHSLLYLVTAYKNKENQQGRAQYIQKSLDEIHFLQQRLKESEHAPFVNWYANDSKFGIKKIEERLNKFLVQQPAK